MAYWLRTRAIPTASAFAKAVFTGKTCKHTGGWLLAYGDGRHKAHGSILLVMPALNSPLHWLLLWYLVPRLGAIQIFTERWRL